MKYKILIIMIIFILIVFGSGITYSIFHSNSMVNVGDKNIANFVFNAEITNHLQFDLVDLIPGGTEEYSFKVTNNQEEKVSNVAINYQIVIKTFHIMPLTIELYKIENKKENLIMTCDERYSRNLNNELVCNSPLQTMQYSQNTMEDYKIKVTFPVEYNGEEYSNLIDYIDVEIKGSQKTTNEGEL